MAEKQLLLEVVTPDRLVLSTEADVVVCPGVEGQFGVLPGHIPFSERPGNRRDVLPQGRPDRIPGGERRLCRSHRREGDHRGRSAEKGREIDVDRARRAQERAEKRLAAAKTENIDWARAEAAMRRSLVRSKVAGR